MDDALIIVRALHFAATALVTGTIIFQVFIGESAFPSIEHSKQVQALRRRFAQLAGMSLAIALISGAAWFYLFVGAMGRQLPDMSSGEIAWTVLTETRFGHAWLARFMLAALLAGCLLSGIFTWPVAGLAAGLVGALSWSGHAGAAPGLRGDFNAITDAVHLIAAAAWLGGLMSLALLLKSARAAADPTWVAVTARATDRFSNLGLASVGALLATGMVNTWSLVDSASALVRTAYGQLLLVKIALFFTMVCIASVNRLVLAPRIAQLDAMHQLQRNCVVEIALGMIILAIVGALGTMSPMAQVHTH